MTLFEFPDKEVLTTRVACPGPERVKTAAYTEGIAAASVPDYAGTISFISDTGARPSQDNLMDQFVVFQLGRTMSTPSVLESSQNEPALDGSDEEPDVLLRLEMQSFVVGQNENIAEDVAATMRINLGKDENSRDKYFDTAFWSIAAGIDLYDQMKKKRADAKDYKSDFAKAFGNRPIEIPGGLSKMSFEVVKHRTPPWWKKIFGFLESGVGKSLVSVLGFPAITSQAIHMLDELLNKLDGSEPEVLFKSIPLRLALSKQAKLDYTSGNERIRIGCLNPGFFVMARARDFSTFVNSDCVYYPSYGRLVPSGISEADIVRGNYRNPFQDTTYAVFRVGMKKTKLDPTFNYRV